ncbi:hypothetical protein [uncultured Lamprocystis sp.]|nr:hypothetical protein [uncultured Lamprocystis sp.]
MIKTLQRLFSVGTCAADDGALAPLLTGLAHLSPDGGRWVISRQLLGLRQTLSGDQEVIAAVLATQLEIRMPWVRLLAARCREAGQLADANALVQLVSRLGGAAAWVEAAMAQATLDPTTASALERELFGYTADQAQATPVLTRVMAAASQLAHWQQRPLPGISPIDRTGERVDANWCPGRLVAHPDGAGPDEDFILGGRWPGEEGADPLAWVQRGPWPLLLAAIGYVQDSWAAEARGGLLLELPPGQYPHHPTEIAVLVAGDDGAEVLCGSLGGFVLGLLSRLNMALFPAPLTEAALNARLSPLIGELQRRQVWRFQEGLSGQQGFYRVHPKFSDACYQISGVRTLGLNGRGLRRAIREQAEQWRIERQGGRGSPQRTQRRIMNSLCPLCLCGESSR